ncbi:MAG: hypothetical protein L6R40_002304 [Gallowayella cf. fulva]|nr:MAG: hypothetical protein L6R40_002304 [Xanthomendoza cf. fulva]
MEQLQAKHRQEQKDLQARVTQKKKSATKKTRKGVNDECTELERQMKERHALELAQISGQAGSNPDSLITNESSSDPASAQGVVNSSGPEYQRATLSVSPVNIKAEQPKKPNRQKARLARRAAEQEYMISQAAEEAQGLPDLRQKEIDDMRTHYAPKGLTEHEIRSDGHCLYAAIADQLTTQARGLLPKIPLSRLDGIPEPSSPAYRIARSVTAAYIQEYADDFIPFLEEPLDQYVRKIRDTGEWGGHLELLALAKAYDVNINVLQSSGQIEKIESGADETRSTLWLSYYHHNFGLGEHYNSLRPAE